jgi:hypothetical protein
MSCHAAAITHRNRQQRRSSRGCNIQRHAKRLFSENCAVVVIRLLVSCMPCCHLCVKQLCGGPIVQAPGHYGWAGDADCTTVVPLMTAGCHHLLPTLSPLPCAA